MAGRTQEVRSGKSVLKGARDQDKTGGSFQPPSVIASRDGSWKLPLLCLSVLFRDLRGEAYCARFCRYAFTVFFISIATVIGPTPPGTGVIFAQSGETVGKWTSPVRR